VTGANHGIGAATAQALARRGFDTAEAQLGPVDILVTNATGWLADTFAATSAELAGDQAVDQHGSGKAREYRRGLRSPRKSMKPIEFVR
jgi:NAD(P)-dependent dehydrogenase (short-subunit alcohol dehydrogenase family)